MYTVYILYSIIVDRYYVGLSSDVKGTVKRHNNGKNKHTKTGIPWNPVYYEEFSEIDIAVKREMEIKSSDSREMLTRIIQSDRNIF